MGTNKLPFSTGLMSYMLIALQSPSETGKDMETVNVRRSLGC